MRPVECQFEADVLSAALQPNWPHRADAALLAHVAQCPICSDVATVARAIDASAEHTRAQANIPDSGRVWWLAQHRARQEAARTAGRPITAIQVIAFACASGLLGACFGATSIRFQDTLHWIGSAVASFDFQSLAAALAGHGFLALVMAVMLFVVPTAVYLLVGRDR